MKALQISDVKTWKRIDIAEPGEPGPGEALVRVHRMGVCGTDIGCYLGRFPYFEFPRIPGHELGVEVLAIGDGVTNVTAGDRCCVERYLNCGKCDQVHGFRQLTAFVPRARMVVAGLIYVVLTLVVIAQDRPNVILIVTDDQGYGDMSCHGNPWLNTPNLDHFAAESVRLEDYHVDPVCTPTRAALMTGRYCTRVGAWAVTQGRQLLADDERTMADIFLESGYRTGIFGKWHLGDTFPFAPHFRGFGTAVVHRAGGVDEIGNPPDNDYFDDTYYRNGVAESFQGYCTDIWFSEAIQFIKDTPAEQPFFVYLPTNAMHSPHMVAPEYSQRFDEQGLPEQRGKFYGMIENFDENLGRLLTHLDEAGLTKNTIVIFMGDNGTAQGSNGKPQSEDGFNAGMHGKKGSVYEGGHRVACFARWPGHLPAGLKVDQLTSQRDWLPTLIEWCHLASPQQVLFDATSMAAILTGDDAHWPDRTLFIERQDDTVQPGVIDRREGNVPFSVLTEQWRMVNGELYDISKDPSQLEDVASQHPGVVEDLYRRYLHHYKEVMQHGGSPVAIPVGHNHSDVVEFTVRDWHPTQGAVIWQHDQLGDDALWINGWWQIDVQRAGRVEVRLHRFPDQWHRAMGATAAEIQFGSQSTRKDIDPSDSSVTIEMMLPAGLHRLQTFLFEAQSGQTRGAYFVEIKSLSDSN